MGALQSTGSGDIAGNVIIDGEATISVLGALHLPNGLDDAPLAVLNKIGPGDLLYEGTGSFSGQINVYQGTLTAQADMANRIAVFQDGQLRGDGSVGYITSTAGTIRPGTDGPGLLSDAGDLHLDAASRIVFQLAGTIPVVEYDQLTVVGEVQLGDAQLVIDLSFNPSIGDTFVLINNAGFDAVQGTFKTLPEGATFVIDGVIFKITYHYPGSSGNDVAISVTGFVTADLSAQISASPSPVGAGGLLTLAATVVNAGPQDAANVVVTVGTPGKTTFESVTAPAGWLCSKPAAGGTGNVSCTKSGLANGAVANFTIVVRVNAGATGDIVAVAAVTASSNDPATANNSASVTVPIGAPDARPHKVFLPMVAADQ
jgi:uncharacterized repeat protein (TIGR01451 family)